MTNEFKRTLKGIRSDLEISQGDMAKKLGIGIATYQRYERYENAIPCEILIKIADIAGIVDVREIKFKN